MLLRTARSEIGQRQRVASMLRAKPVKGAPNVVGTPAIVGIPLWVVAHVAVLGDVAGGAGALERGLVPRGVSELVTGADGLGLSATDGGLMPPLPSSVEPSGIPARLTDEPGPIDEARGADAVADAAQAPGALAAIPPPSERGAGQSRYRACYAGRRSRHRTSHASRRRRRRSASAWRADQGRRAGCGRAHARRCELGRAQGNSSLPDWRIWLPSAGSGATFMRCA